MGAESLKLSPVPKPEKTGNTSVCFGSVYEYRPQPGEKISKPITYVVTDVLKPEDEVFSAAVLEYDEQGPYLETPALGRDPWQVGEVLGKMPPGEVLKAYRRGWLKKFLYPCPVEIFEGLRLAAHKGPKPLFKNGKNIFFITDKEIFGDDWTKNYDSKDLKVSILGTEIIDPYRKSDQTLSPEDISEINKRPPLVIDHDNYLQYCQKFHQDESTVAFFIAKVFAAREGRGKLGVRQVHVISPVVIDGDQFNGNENMLPYLLKEKELELAEVLPKLRPYGPIDELELNMIRQTSMKTVMETALYNGDLQQYLEFHKSLYLKNSKNPDAKKQFEIRQLAKTDVIAEYRSPLSMISNALLSIAGKGSAELYENLKKVQKKQGFTPLQLKQVPLQK